MADDTGIASAFIALERLRMATLPFLDPDRECTGYERKHLDTAYRQAWELIRTRWVEVQTWLADDESEDTP